MGRRSVISRLPPDVRAELDRRIVAAGFGDYREHEAWLAERGIELSYVAVSKYGAALAEKLENITAATRAAEALRAANPDDASLLSSAVVGMIEAETFGVMIRFQEASAEEDPAVRLELLGKAARAAADLARASVTLKKRADEVEARARVAADAAEKIARRGGLSAESVNELRAQILGIAA